MLIKKSDSEILQYALEYFQDYIKYETTSDPKNPDCPSNEKMWDLANLIKKDLEDLGLEVLLDKNCYLYTSLPANQEAKYSLGLIAHMDTSPDMNGKDVKARRVTYHGKDIILNEKRQEFKAGYENPILLSESLFPQLAKENGKDIIITDGHSLLGADNKAGISEIMALVKYLIKHPEIPHGDLQIAFTPDEEIGRGADLFNVEGFGADYAFTIDGGSLGEIEWENFNAASALVTVKGLNVHPGAAKNKMRNAITLAAKYALALPDDEKPETTEAYEGFFHLTEINGTVEDACLEYIIRDFDLKSFESRKKYMQELADELNKPYGEEIFKVEITDSYYNMKEKIKPHLFIVDYAKQAMKEAGVQPLDVPIRGGTDGARLSYMGLPCPNLFTGGENFHGKYEYLAVETAQKILDTLIKLVGKFI